MAEAKIALYALTAGLVLDRSVFVGQTVDEMKATVATLRSSANSKKTVTVIENGNTFFTSSNMLELIKVNDPAYKLIAEKAKVVLRDNDVQIIRTAEEAKKAIEASMIPSTPPYPFLEVPGGFDIYKKFEIFNAGKSIRRIGSGHTLSLTQAQLIWRYLSENWARNQIVQSKYFRDHRVFCLSGNTYRIGCQEVQRFEIEQIALWQGWAFPEVSAKK